MGLQTIQLFIPDSSTPKQASLEYDELVENIECHNGHAFWFRIEEDPAYPKLTEYLVSIGVTDKCLMHVTW